MFEVNFKNELSAITRDNLLIERFWVEVKERYSESHRYYHTMSHLNALTEELLPVKNEIHDWQLLVFSIAYHDIIYEASNNNNEEESARLAYLRLGELGMEESRKQKCFEQIMATKKHEWNENADTNYFTDSDLAILGAGSKSYLNYTLQIRREYQIYPDLIYKPGRKRVLQHFLNMDFIYKTSYFRDKYERQARENITSELSGFQ